MKIKAISFVLLFASASAASATEVDVTNHPDRAFFDGYSRLYKRFDDGSVCEAAYAKFRSGHEQIGLNVLCDGLGISESKVYQDLLTAMTYVKEHSSATSFSSYFSMSRFRYFTDEPRDFCIFRNAVTYIFTSTRSTSSPDWRIISTSHNTPGSGTAVFGLWKVDQRGEVIGKIGLNRIQPEVINVNMKDASDCGSTKPYEPGRLLPSD
ncbi:hypothetical protein KDH83_12885 [Achromobacter sp. Marseille-Q0513]|uniref:hypothetical protein n=1 Tax=Achromobacter sp. Marseille-Q0513 TaxID=2829161 RepID=UPI001B9B8D99|nr:hypothetical protein [Achromobacter sp. Marseille-Q0513]MBR8654189.1 hypothetical protein [Achromobacter sp. Marseille-Q0513]